MDKDSTFPSSLNGYRPSHRNKWLYVRYRLLSVQQLALLEYYADALDFGRGHPKFGLVEVDFDQIAKIFNCCSTTIRNWHKRLLLVGFIKRTPKRHWFQVVCAPRYISPGFWQGEAAIYAEKEKDQSVEIILQNFGINFQSIEEKLQPVVKTESQNPKSNKPIAIGSSKNDSRLYPNTVLIKQGVRSNDEYQQIQKGENYQYLTIDDMRWIDENVTETKEIASAVTEADYVEIFFDGDWEKYRNSIIT